MKICIVAEGCYPYVVGGVSSWIDSLIRSFPEHEFIILAIIANRDMRGKFVYELPENVTEVQEMYLTDLDWSGTGGQASQYSRRRSLKKKDYEALKGLILNYEVDWKELFTLFEQDSLSVNDLLMSQDFLEVSEEVYRMRYQGIPFSDYLWTMRSIYLPLFLAMKFPVPDADLYHCVATGYAGVLGAMAREKYHCGLLISEHGLYTREREEELIKASWVQGVYKGIWIEQFRKMSTLSYNEADLVTSLFSPARYEGIPGKDPDDNHINIGAILRVTPIKDVKTMINAFAFAKKEDSRLKLWIMGSMDEEPEYTAECMKLIEDMELSDIEFTGRINVPDYMGKMDMTILTSISEGQPLTILESYAAKVPVIATDVGNCRGLIYGEDDDFGPAGILTHIMNIEEIARAMLTLSRSEKKRREYGEAGYRRLMKKYKLSDMKDTYRRIYEAFDHANYERTPQRKKDTFITFHPENLTGGAEEKDVPE